MSKRTLALQIIHTLRKNGYEAYFVGGCVRDILLNIEAVRWGILSTADKKFRRLSSMFPIHRYQKVEECETTESVP